MNAVLAVRKTTLEIDDYDGAADSDRDFYVWKHSLEEERFKWAPEGSPERR